MHTLSEWPEVAPELNRCVPPLCVDSAPAPCWLRLAELRPVSRCGAARVLAIPSPQFVTSQHTAHLHNTQPDLHRKGNSLNRVPEEEQIKYLEQGVVNLQQQQQQQNYSLALKKLPSTLIIL